jgi:hypothetical protein
VGRSLPLPQPLAVGPNRPPRLAKFTHTKFNRAQNGHRTIALSTACLGFLCSFCWTLGNRGSKYWQEVWEKKVECAAENVAMTNIFPRSTNPKIEERWFWGPKQFSPSKLVIAVSDLVVAGWIVLGVAAVVPRMVSLDTAYGKVVVGVANLVVVLFTVAYGFAIFFWCRSGQPLKCAEVKSIIKRWFRISN